MILNPPPQPIGVPYGNFYVYLPKQVTPALVAKDRLKAIINKDRQSAPAWRWVKLRELHVTQWWQVVKGQYRWERRK